MAHEVKRIEKEFIFKTLMDDEAPVSIHIKDRRYHGRFTLQPGKRVSLLINSDTPMATAPKRVILFFRFRGTSMTSQCVVHSYHEGLLQLEMPDRVYRDLSRSFERVLPAGPMNVSIVLDGQSYKLDFPSSQSYYEPATTPDLDKKFNPEKIAQLIQGFRDKAREMGSENKIIMFRERKQETVIEKLISVSGKALLVPFDDLRSFTESFPRQRSHLITNDDLIRLFREMGMDPMTGVNTIRAYMERRRHQKIWQELYCPVLYREYVVGYILLVRGDVHTGPLTPEMLEFIVQFSRLLSYSLKQNGYFKEIPVQEEFNKSELLDISGSGMLFSYPLDGPELNLYMDIDVKIHTDEKIIPVNGRIMRIYRDSQNVYLGLQFMELTSEDHSYLLSYIYGSDYDGKIEVYEEEVHNEG